MLKRFVAAFAFIVASPTLNALEGPTEPTPVDVGVVCRSTEFYVHNFSTSTQVLVFHLGDYHTWRVLAPGTSFSSSYTRQMLDGVTLEIANYDAGVWRTSRSFDMATLCDTGADALWLRNTVNINSWLEVSDVLTEITPGPTMLPSNFPSTAQEAWSTSAPEFEPTHVPIVDPDDEPQGDVPPVLGDRPPPPV
jgi:hypothetical protein